ncbi:MAG: SDR family oxidoreductase, partial [Alphaproteobacteria bacterium]
ARLVVASRTKERLAAARAELGDKIETHALDATREDEVRRLFERIGRFDHLAVLTPAAGSPRLSQRLGPLLDMDTATFRAVLESKFWAPVHCAKHAAPHMARDGSITFVSGMSSRKAIPGYASSAAANGALEALMRLLALELAPIRVNVIAPGFIATPIIDELPPERREAWNRMLGAQPVPRMGTAEEVAEAILYAMGNGFTTGTVLEIDGGYKLT